MGQEKFPPPPQRLADVMPGFRRLQERFANCDFTKIDPRTGEGQLGYWDNTSGKRVWVEEDPRYTQKTMGEQVVALLRAFAEYADEGRAFNPIPGKMVNAYKEFSPAALDAASDKEKAEFIHSFVDQFQTGDIAFAGAIFHHRKDTGNTEELAKGDMLKIIERANGYLSTKENGFRIDSARVPQWSDPSTEFMTFKTPDSEAPSQPDASVPALPRLAVADVSEAPSKSPITPLSGEQFAKILKNNPNIRV